MTRREQIWHLVIGIGRRDAGLQGRGYALPLGEVGAGGEGVGVIGT
jgi:hypothetical protein